MTAAASSFRFSSSRDRRRLATGLLFISPWILGFIVFRVYPFLASLYYSFTFYPVLRSPRWLGWDNYVNLFDDPASSSRSGTAPIMRWARFPWARSSASCWQCC